MKANFKTTAYSVARKHLNAASLFIIIGLVFGSFFVLKTPPLWGVDETSHIARAYQVSGGHVFGQKLTNVQPRGGGYGGKIPQSLGNLITYVDINLETTGNISGKNSSEYSKLDAFPLNDTKTVEYAFPNTVPYSPVAYLPSAVAIKIASMFNLSIGTTIYFARFFSLFAYILIVYLAIRALGSTRFKWVVFIVALLPTTVAQASVITADTMTNAVAILTIALIIKGWLKQRFSKTEIAELVVAAALLPLLKPTYFVIALLVLLVPNLVLSKSIIKARVIKIGSVAISFVSLTVWSYLTRNTVNTIAILIPGNNWNLIHPHAQEKLLEHDPLTFVKATTRTFIGSDGTYLNQLIGVMGFTAITVPGITLISYLTAMFLSLGIAERIKLRLSSSIIAFLILIGGILGILGTLYVTATPVGYPVINEITGRYFVPYLLLLLALIAANTRLRHSQYFNSKVAIVGLVIIGLLFSCLKYQYFIYHGLAYHS